MAGFRRWGLIAMAVLLACAGMTRAQEDGGNDIAAAIATVKASSNPENATDSNFRFRFATARRNLVEQGMTALPEIVKLLDENRAQLRVNAGILFAQIAAEQAEGEAPAPEPLVSAIKRCLRDQNDGVVYWGFIGMMNANVPESEKLDAVNACLELERPRILREAVAAELSQRGFKAAVPALIRHMVAILPAYETQVKDALTFTAIEEGGDRRGREYEDETGRSRLYDRIQRERDAERERLERQPSGYYEEGYYEERMRRDRREFEPGDDLGAVDLLAQEIVIDPDELMGAELEDLIPIIQALPATEELHLIGIYTETLVSQNPTDPVFGFKSTAPWELESCVEKAAAWLEAGGFEQPAEE